MTLRMRNRVGHLAARSAALRARNGALQALAPGAAVIRIRGVFTGQNWRLYAVAFRADFTVVRPAPRVDEVVRLLEATFEDVDWAAGVDYRLQTGMLRRAPAMCALGAAPGADRTFGDGGMAPRVAANDRRRESAP